jgi:hypothetical protein
MVAPLVRQIRIIALPLVTTAALTVSLLAAPAPQRPALDDVLRIATEHYATYAANVSGVNLHEQYQLINVTSDRMQPPVRISSDLVLVNVNTGLVGLRDVYAVDTKPTREFGPRIVALLAPPATPTIRDWDTVARFPAEGLVHFALDLIVKLNDPTFALRFLSAEWQPKVKWKIDGNRKINNVATVGLGFDEQRGQTTQYLIGTRGNGRAFGRLWVDPVSGAVHETELFVESAADSASIKVKFSPHATLGHNLPVETLETYTEKQAGNAFRGEGGAAESGAGASKVSFQATAKYSNATYSPIDLRTLKR